MTAGTESAARAADSKPVELLGRVGLVGYGVVNLLVAWLAAQVAFGDSGGEGASKGGALTEIAGTAWGGPLLWVVAVSLFALALWQLGQAIWGRKSHGGVAKRIVHVVEALVFAFLGYTAAKIAAGGKSQSNSEQAGLTASVLNATGGQVLVAAVGLAVIGAAVYLFLKGLKRKFLKDLDMARASAGTRRTTTRLGQAGYMALGVAYAIVGALIVTAAVQHDPAKATGLDTALATLAQQPYGQILLLIVALGVAAFGVYCFLDARFRKT